MFEDASPLEVAEDRSPRDGSQAWSQASDGALQRSNGSGRLVVSGAEDGARLREVFQRSPIRWMFPRCKRASVQEAVLLNTAGGIAGGDRLDISVTCQAGASLAVTTQAAEKVYGALSESARISTRLTACEGSKLAWLPHETIIFNRARLSRVTEVFVCEGAELLALEWLVLGRAAHGEEVVAGNIADAWRVRNDGRLVWADCFYACDETFPHLSRKALLESVRAFGTLIYFGRRPDTQVELARKIAPSLPCQCGATSVAGLMVVRLAAAASFDLKVALRALLQQFGREHGPPFGTPKMWSC